MTEDPRERDAGWRRRFLTGFFSAKNLVWGWLFDPAVLVYRRHGFGRSGARDDRRDRVVRARSRSRVLEHRGDSRAASLAYTTLLSLIRSSSRSPHPQELLRESLPRIRVQIDTILNAVVPYRSPQITYHLTRFTENAATASTVGAVAFMIIAFRLFLAVEGAVNQIWKVRSQRGYRSKIMAFTMLFFGIRF
jgi:hypothetical protein